MNYIIPIFYIVLYNKLRPKNIDITMQMMELIMTPTEQEYIKYLCKVNFLHKKFSIKQILIIVVS